ncbi:MAG: esterase [Gemmatimonadetes bacterium]|nr:MAG: esterase [Gemmatimonadota bacterium]
MNREIHSWWSPHLNKEMPIAVYGHFGFALLMIPTAAADFLEYERFHLINAIRHHIEAGRVKVFSIDSINRESWLSDMHPAHKAIRHQQYNEYIRHEVIPFIHHHCRGRVLTITSGASLGAFHAANLLFKYPDVIDGTIAMSGIYDISKHTGGYWDENIHFNNPFAYLNDMPEGPQLWHLRAKNHIIIATGSGAYEVPYYSEHLGWLLYRLGINYQLDVWGPEWRHDWPTWRAMLPTYIETRF